MSIFSGIVIYALIWWMAFFCILPFHIRTHFNAADGSMPGAPADPDLKRKAIVTTIISCAGWLAVYFLITSDLISFRAIAQHMAR